jgi:hypothetical protein
MTTNGSSIDFFVSYAQSEGALAELVPEGAVLVLPEEMRTTLDLPEEVGLTEDPETAREDGFLLIAAGHPLLLTAAGTVLARGDVGCSSIPRPTGLPPTPTALEGRAREQIHADHGRIDVTGVSEQTSVVVLQLGALLTYSVSIDERVQELEEVWAFAETGHPVPAELRERVRAAALEPGVPVGIETPAAEAVSRAHEALCSRARRRVDELARQTSLRLRAQLGVVDDYYQRVLTSIAERLDRAAPDRAAMLTEQAEATKREWERRRSEVADDLTPTFEVQPFRLHLIAVPSYTVQAAVRRGARAHTLPLSYVPILSSFLQPRCPSCGSEAVLVAGKDCLSCRACTAAASSPAETPTDQPEDIVPVSSPPDRGEDAQNERSSGKSSVTKPAPLERGHAGAAGRRLPSREAWSASPKLARPTKRSTGRVTPKGSPGGATNGQAGIRMATSFWSSVRSGELRPRDAVANSPMRTLLHLYGSLGPAHVVGVDDLRQMVGISSSPVLVEFDGTCTIEGELKSFTDEEFPFALFWRSGSRSSMIEIEPFPLERVAPMLARRDEYGRIFRERYRHFLVAPPEPIIELDPTAELLLDRATKLAGLGYAVRCLAAWDYLTERDGRADSSIDRLDPSEAAAIESIVGKRLEMRLTVPALAERYGCSPESVRRHLKSRQPLVRDRTDLRW